jgi:hypothetical protein
VFLAQTFLVSLVMTLLYRPWQYEVPRMSRRDLALAVGLLAVIAAVAVALEAAGNRQRAGDFGFGFAFTAGIFGGFLLDDVRRRRLGLDGDAPASMPVGDD